MAETRLCPTCGKAFEVSPGSHRRYCSQPCRPNHRKPRKRRPPAKVVCAQCGKTFERTAWVAEMRERSGHAQYCSTECRDAAKRGRKGQRRTEWIVIECEACGGEFEVRPSRRNRRFCSHRCAGRAGGRPGDPKTRFVDGDGYVNVYLPPDQRPPGQKKKSHQREHRLVMSKMLGRWPEPDETIHHINGDKTDNRPENLQLRHGRHGKGGVLRCRACGSSDIEHIDI